MIKQKSQTKAEIPAKPEEVSLNKSQSLNPKSARDTKSAAKETPSTKTPKEPAKSPEPTSMEELLAQTGYQLKGWQRGTIIKGVVLVVSPRQLLLDIGGKSEAVVHEKELPYIADLTHNLKVGDTISVQVVNPENDRGQTVVSLRKTALNQRWEIMADKKQKGEVVEVVIRELTRGGVFGDYVGQKGFIPLSQVVAATTKMGDKATGRRISVKIIEVDKDANRLVFSQGPAGVSDKQRAALKLVTLGNVYVAEVTGIAPFGAFVNVKISDGVSIPGLIHISEIAWEKVDSPQTYLKIGQKVDVKAIGADPKIGKLTLSLKQLLADPWLDVTKVFSIDQTVKGKVSRVSQYGIFVSLLPGIDGLIHISKLAPGTEPKAGEEVECMIEDINPDRHKISLSLVTHAKPIGYR